MGKRKLSAFQQNKEGPSNSASPSSGNMYRSSGMALLSKQKPSPSVDPHELKPLSYVMDVTDGPGKLSNAHHSMLHHHQGLGRTLFLKRSRHYYGHPYSRRDSVSHANASTSQEELEKAYFRRDRIRSIPLRDAASSEMVKMICGTCNKPMRQKYRGLGNTVSSCEPSVVAVLVCGHIYHADCLEQRTSIDDKHDPPCPLCLGCSQGTET